MVLGIGVDEMELLPTFDAYADDELIADTSGNIVHMIKDTSTLAGTINDINAVKQACFCILATEQDIHKIYDSNYGLQTFDLIGKDYSYIASELKRRIREALMQDDRINDVRDFVIERVKKDGIHLSFVVECNYGDISMDKTVKVVEGDN